MTGTDILYLSNPTHSWRRVKYNMYLALEVPPKVVVLRGLEEMFTAIKSHDKS